MICKEQQVYALKEKLHQQNLEVKKILTCLDLVKITIITKS